MAYQEVAIESVKVDDLQLDLSNYRFASDQPDESAAMNYLFVDHDAMAVATLILRDGYVDNELPIVVEEDGHHVIVEGNRRLSALRALRNPSLVPAHAEALRRLLKRHALEAENLPETIRVMVLPDRGTAAAILARLHIGESKRSWSLDEQAKFVLAQLTDGVGVQALKEMLPAIKDVPRLVRMGRMREMLRRCSFTDPVIAGYAHGARLPMSAFEYAYRNPEIQELIGVRFDVDGNLIQETSTQAQIAALEVLLGGFKRKELSSRKVLNDKSDEEYMRLLANMRGQIMDSVVEPGAEEPASDSADASPTEGPSPSDDSRGAQSASGATDGATPASYSAARGPNDPETRTTLEFTGIDERAVNINLRHRMRELRRINVLEFPAAAALLTRTVLESAIKEHYGIASGQAVRRQLSDVMQDVTRDYASIGALAHAISTVNRTGRGADQVPGSGEWFNLIAHTVDMPVGGRQVHQAWRVVFPLIRFLLDRPAGSQL